MSISLRKLMLASLASVFMSTGLALVSEAQADPVFRYKEGILSMAGEGCGVPPCSDDNGEADDDGGSGDDASEDIGIILNEDDIIYDPGDNPPPARLTLTPTAGSGTPDANRVVYQCFLVAGGFGNYIYAADSEFEGDSSWIEEHDLVSRAALGSPMSGMASHDFGGVPTYIFPSYDPVAGTAPVTGEDEVCFRARLTTDSNGSNGTASAYFIVTDYPEEVVNSGQVLEDELFFHVYHDIELRLVPACADPDGCDSGGTGYPVIEELTIIGPNNYLTEGRNYFPFKADGGTGEYSWIVQGDVSYYDVDRASPYIEVQGDGPWTITVIVRDTMDNVATMTHVFTDRDGPEPECNWDYWDDVIDCDVQ